jgi:hypothetical protein
MTLNKAADMTSVVMLNVAMLNVVAPEKAIECLDNKNKKKVFCSGTDALNLFLP